MTKIRETQTEKDYSIKLSTLGLVIVSIIIGAIGTYIANNQVKGEIINFSTIELISFVVSLLLSSASLVLAVIAINLGKSSEKIMLERNDETFRLQNEVFSKTIEALSRIESSTGVTEKRIEDIISGRAGDLAERLVDDRIVTRKDKGTLEEEIKSSLLRELSGSDKKAQQEKELEKRRLTQEASKRYNLFKDQILLAISNSEKTKALKIGSGTFRGDKDELLDGFFEISGKKVGVCTFSGEAILSDQFLVKSLDEFINKLSLEISNKVFDKVYLVFDSETDTTTHYKESLAKITALMKPDIADNIIMLVTNNTTDIQAIITGK